MTEPGPQTHITREEPETLQLRANLPNGKGLSIETFLELTREVLRLRAAISKHKAATEKAKPLFHTDGSRGYMEALEEISEELWKEAEGA